jgi:hypothetical protein
MPFHSRSAYGPDPHAGANRNNAAQRGWGSGWPNCQKKQARVSKAGVVVPVRREIAELVAVLFEATEKRFKYDIKSGQTWGFACRAIRGTNVPSNHSWGLAVDINSLTNPMQSTFKSDMPPAMVQMWEACGFYWGGRYRNRPDAMHYEYIFRPTDVAKHLTKARRYLSGTAKPSPKPTGKTTAKKSGYETYRKGIASGSRTIRQSAAGDDVKELQRICNSWYPSESPRLAVDGYFGSKTTNRTKYAQKKAKIAVDGIVGPATWRALKVIK